MIEMSMPDQNNVRTLDVSSLEAKRRKHTATIEMSVEKNDLSVVNQLEIGVTGPPDRERLWIFGKSSPG